MNISSKTNLFLVAYILILVIVMGAYVFLIFNINSKKVAASAVLSQIDLLEKQNDQLKDLSTVLEEINEDQDKLNSYFVDANEIVDFLEAVEEIGRESGAEVEVRSLNEEETSNPAIGILTLNLTAKGDWKSVYHFLALIQNFPVTATFDKIHLSGKNRIVEDEEGNSTKTEVEWKGVFNMRVLELKK